jgi:hypothetical protein
VTSPCTAHWRVNVRSDCKIRRNEKHQVQTSNPNACLNRLLHRKHSQVAGDFGGAHLGKESDLAVACRFAKSNKTMRDCRARKGCEGAHVEESKSAVDSSYNRTQVVRRRCHAPSKLLGYSGRSFMVIEAAR